MLLDAHVVHPFCPRLYDVISCTSFNGFDLIFKKQIESHGELDVSAMDESTT